MSDKDMIRKCRVCGRLNTTIKFHSTKNLCSDDYNAYMAKWKKDNADHIKEYRSTPEFKAKHRASVSKAQQRSPEAFLRQLSIHIRKYSKYKLKNNGRLNPACLDVKIDYDYLLALYQKQGGHCALLNIPMTHEFNNLKSISVDRIDSSLGYIPGNVQLLTQFAQLGKNNGTNSECILILNEFGKQYMDSVIKKEYDMVSDLFKKAISDIPGIHTQDIDSGMILTKPTRGINPSTPGLDVPHPSIAEINVRIEGENVTIEMPDQVPYPEADENGTIKERVLFPPRTNSVADPNFNKWAYDIVEGWRKFGCI